MATDTIVYSVSVDYGMSVEELVGLSQYDSSDRKITSKNFPTKRMGTAEIAVMLIHFNRYVLINKALRLFNKEGFRPVELLELLALGQQYPKLRREFPVIALGSVWTDLSLPHGFPYRSSVPCFLSFDEKSHLALHPIKLTCSPHYRFAVIL